MLKKLNKLNKFYNWLMDTTLREDVEDLKSYVEDLEFEVFPTVPKKERYDKCLESRLHDLEYKFDALLKNLKLVADEADTVHDFTIRKRTKKDDKADKERELEVIDF